MGGSQSGMKAAVTGPCKKVVIIGASFGGRIITNMLLKCDPQEKQYEIMLIDKNEHFEFICVNYMAMVEDTAFAQNSIKFEEAVKSYQSKRVCFKQGKLCKVLSE
jgi:NADH dehydrogenase FAD-containing subunit